MSTFETTLGHAFDSIFIQFSPILYFSGRGPVRRCRRRASQSRNVDDPRDLPTGLPFPLPPPHEENQETVQPLRAVFRRRLLRRVHGAAQGSHRPSHSQRTYAGTFFSHVLFFHQLRTCILRITLRLFFDVFKKTPLKLQHTQNSHKIHTKIRENLGEKLKNVLNLFGRDFREH